MLDITQDQKDQYYIHLGVRLMLLHHVEDAEIRWQPLIEGGATDEEILDRIGDELGIYGGQSLDEHYFVDGRGGANPRIEITQLGKPCRDVALFQGSQLVAMARKLLRVPPKGQMLLL